MAIKDWPEDDRPREKLLKHGAARLTEAELLAVMLRTGIRGRSALDLGRELQARFGSVSALLAADYQKLAELSGLKKAKGTQLMAVLELARRALLEQLKSGVNLSSPAAVREYLRLTLRHPDKEVFVGVFLDAQNRVIAAEELSHGTLTQTSVYPREVVRRALHCNAAAVIFAHNHPSGLAEPSRADEVLTQALKQALALVDVKVLDHFVVGAGSCDVVRRARTCCDVTASRPFYSTTRSTNSASPTTSTTPDSAATARGSHLNCRAHSSTGSASITASRLPDLHAQIERQQRPRKPSAGQPELAQHVGEAEPVHQPEQEAHRRAVRHRPLQEQVLRGDVGDRKCNGALDQPLGQHDHVERRQYQRDAVRSGEGGDDLQQRPEIAAAQNQREQEQQVVVAAQDMLDAEQEEAAKRLVRDALANDALVPRARRAERRTAGFLPATEYWRSCGSQAQHVEQVVVDGQLVRRAGTGEVHHDDDLARRLAAG